MRDYIIRETEDYPKLVPFFMENELEFTEEDKEEVPTDTVKCWEIVTGPQQVAVSQSAEDGQTAEDEQLIGGFVLAKREGEFICDGIAIDPAWRQAKLGKALLELGLEEVRKQGGNSMYLVARAPEFFRKNGFVTIPREEAPNFFECLTCPQYGKTCHPEVMRIDL